MSSLGGGAVMEEGCCPLATAGSRGLENYFPHRLGLWRLLSGRPTSCHAEVKSQSLRNCQRGTTL